ncbi:MAG: helix-turn-helix transcriptional regulator [Microlunatus sp.]|nr:helix-turn-helix transcriptional regulator [Microlunatus sp.]
MFAESGAGGSLDEIARRAGVASGTLYRHFPSRIDLIQVVLAEQLAELVDLGRGLLATDDAFTALEKWLAAILQHGLTYRGLTAAVMNSALDSRNELVAHWHQELFEVGDALLGRAQRAGVVVDARTDDVLRLVSAIAWASQDDDDAEQADRLLGHILAGLRR